MLAVAVNDEELASLTYPRFLSPKIDGVRATVINGKLYSRSKILIPNKYTQELFGRPEYEGLDGELVVGNPWDTNLMQQTTSGVMSIEGEPNVSWHIFDKWNVSGHFRTRLENIKPNYAPCIKIVPQIIVYDIDQVLNYEELFIGKGYEGVMLKDPNSPYKQGRSTLREGYMLKVKRFTDAEAEITEVIEQQTNTNEATVDERGYTKRSTAKAGKVAAGVMGVIKGRVTSRNDPFYGSEVEIGTGFTAEQRRNLWEGRKYLIGKLIKYKYFPKGCKDKPRHPKFVGFRDKRDM